MTKKPALCFVVALLTGCGTVSQTLLPSKKPDKQAILQSFSQLPNQPVPNDWQNFSKIFDKNSVKTLDCGELQSGKAITLTGQNQLPAGCDLWQKNTHFVIQNSDTSLDCQGAPMSTDNDKLTAFAIQTPVEISQKGRGVGIRNIRLTNCIAVGYGHGVLVEQALPANKRYEQLLQHTTTRDDQRQLSPNQVLLNRILVADSKNSGIFIGDHVQGVTLVNSSVQHSGTVGVYFEFGSRGNVVQDSQFSQNGIRQVLGVGKPNREAIAIDSSQNNVIKNNNFDSNGGGGIFLYRNCFEHADDPTQANHFLRVDGSNDNLIENNTFMNEPVGVWVAARQSRNLKGFGCGAYLVKEDVTSSYHLDEARQNTVTHNTFNNVEKAVIVEDNNNVISFNRFSANIKQPIAIGSSVRKQSSEGVVRGNQINQNTFDERQTSQPIEFVSNSQDNNVHCDNRDSTGEKLDDVCLVH